MDFGTLGRLLLGVGILLAIVGGLLLLLSRLPFADSFGNLPGDIRVQGENFSCFVPLASMILLSIILTIVLNIIIRIINR
jgi:hypothetical protein